MYFSKWNTKVIIESELQVTKKFKVLQGGVTVMAGVQFVLGIC